MIDISLINTRGDTLYLAALNSTGSAVDIYKSADGVIIGRHLCLTSVSLMQTK